jgi:hypothetical protein
MLYVAPFYFCALLQAAAHFRRERRARVVVHTD